MHTEIHRKPVLSGLFADPSLTRCGNKCCLYPAADAFPCRSGSVFHAFSASELTDSDWGDEEIK